MDNEVIKLLSIAKTPNDIGDMEGTVSAREVLAEVKAVETNQEYQGLGLGLRPTLRLILADWTEYENEQEIEYKSKRYSVIRTYLEGAQLELIAERYDNA